MELSIANFKIRGALRTISNDQKRHNIFGSEFEGEGNWYDSK